MAGKDRTMHEFENSQKRSLKPYQGIVFIIGMFAAYLGLSRIIPSAWGIWGTFLVQLMFILIPVVYVRILGRDLSVVFPRKKPAGIGIGGSIVLWFGSFLINLPISITLTYLFPSAGANTSMRFLNIIQDVPGVVLILIIAVMPAIGEELTFRGVFFHSLSGIRYPLLSALIVGVTFGIFHMDPMKLISTSLIGFLMCLMLIESGNMIYNSFLHFLNNFVSVLMLLLLRGFSGRMPEYQQFMDASVQQADQELNLSILGIYWVMGSLGPFLVYLGFWMIKKADKTKRVEFFPPATQTRNLCLILIPSILAIAVGIICFCLGLFAALQIQ